MLNKLYARYAPDAAELAGRDQATFRNAHYRSATVEARLHRVDIEVGTVPPLPTRLLNPLHMARDLRPRVL